MCCAATKQGKLSMVYKRHAIRAIYRTFLLRIRDIHDMMDLFTELWDGTNGHAYFLNKEVS